MINQQTRAWMEELTQVVGIPGNEKYVSRILQKHYQAMGYEMIFDHLGSVFAVKRSKQENALKVMIAGHMDEVGFIVKSVQDNGLLKIVPVGGIWEQTLLGQRIRLVNRAGEEFPGNIISIPPHLLTDADRAKPMGIDKMLVDIGATSKADVDAMGILPNDMIVVDGPFVEMNQGKRLLSKAWDDRYGLVMGLEMLQALKDVELPYDLYIGGTVQEEVGLRGAQTAAQLINPDMGIVLDCSPANDASGDKDANGKLGEGVLIRFHDRVMLPNKMLLSDFQDTCNRLEVKNQYFYSPGGTDAGAIHKTNTGVPTLTCCLCARNLHTNSTIIDAQDYLGAKNVLHTLLLELTPEKIEAYKGSNQ
ncbi:MAG: M42 family metallopeptidase [Erysipelotrichaceae bacterium]